MYTADDVRSLTEFSSEAYLLTSMYFHSPKAQTLSLKQPQSALKDVFRSAHDRVNHGKLDKKNRQSMEDDCARMMEFLQSQAQSNGARDYGLFACSGLNFFKTLPLPRASPPSGETCVTVGPTFHVRPLLAAMDDFPRYCVAVVDREKASIFSLELNEMRGSTRIEDEVPSYTREAGWSGYQERQIERHVDEEIHRHYQRVIEQLAAFYKRYRFGRLLLGGISENVADFETLLPDDIKRRVIGRVPIDMKSISADQLRRKALEYVRDAGLKEKDRLVARVLDNAGPMGNGTVGLDHTLDALMKREVLTLLVGNGFSCGGKRCSQCGYLGGVMLAQCPQCAGSLEAMEDVVDEAIRMAVLEDAQVRFVADNADFQRAGNIGAILRYRSERKAS